VLMLLLVELLHELLPVRGACVKPGRISVSGMMRRLLRVPTHDR
jgi:hypothetical protein